MSHKFKIVAASTGEYRVQFVYNAEVIVWSENYKSKASAKNCIASLKKNAPSAATADLTAGDTGSGYRFEIAAAKNGETFVRFRARNGETMMRSETYSAKAAAKNAIESIKKNGPKAEIVDESITAKPAAAKKAPAKPVSKKPAAKAAAKTTPAAKAKPAAIKKPTAAAKKPPAKKK